VLHNLKHLVEALVSRVAGVILEESLGDSCLLKRPMIFLMRRITTCTEQARASVPPTCPRRTRPETSTWCFTKGSKPSGKPQNRTVRQSSTALLYARLAARLLSNA